MIPGNSTTIYKAQNNSVAYGLYGATSMPDAIMTELGVPDNILQSDFLNDEGNYAQTYLGNGTVQTWSHTNLRLTSPTPYDEWFGLGIFTMTPKYYLSASATSQLQSYEMSQCGFWQSNIVYTLTTGDAITSTDSYQYLGASGTETFDMTITTSAWPVLITTSAFWPSGWPDTEVWFEEPMWEDGDCDTNEMFPPPPEIAGVYGGCALNATYIQPVAYQMPDGNWPLPLLSGLIPWLAHQPSVVAKYPYINSCWTINGVGQPTVHVAVIQLTTTSTHFITMGGAYTASTTPEVTASVTQSSDASSDIPASASSQTQATDFTTAVVSSSTQALLSSTTVATLISSQTLPTTKMTVPSSSTTVHSPHDSPASSVSASPVSNAETVHQSLEASSTTQKQSSQATSDGIGALLLAISSVAQQQAQSRSSTLDGGISKITTSTGPSVGGEGPARTQPSGTPTITDDTAVPLASDDRYQVGGYTIAAGGSAATVSGTAYSVLSLGTGIQVVADGLTSTVQLVSASGAAIVSLTSGVGYQISGQTITAGGSAIFISGSTYSALPSGSGVQVVVGSLTSTAKPISTIALTTLAGGMIISPIALAASATPSVSFTLSYESLGVNEVLVGSQTLSVGGSAVTDGSQTLALALLGSSLAIVIDGSSTTVLPTATAQQQIVTVGGHTYIAYATSSAIIIDGTTIYPGSATVLNGETVILSGTNLVIAFGNDVSTEGLGAAIMSGLDGSQALYTTPARSVLSTASGQVITAQKTSTAASVAHTSTAGAFMTPIPFTKMKSVMAIALALVLY
ncbi:hypothetical protein LTR85_004487 [Meristemomyces frigidus]|nr:hypothetical protein LTR85_004487 [Meristemomyces frigidus]